MSSKLKVDVTDMYITNADALAAGLEVGDLFIQDPNITNPEADFQAYDVRVVMPSGTNFLV